MKRLPEEIKKIRFQIGNKVYPDLSVEKLKEDMKEMELRDRILYPAIAKRIEENPSETKVCGTCEYYKSKAILDVGSEGICRLGYGWKSFVDSCKRWRWEVLGEM